QHLQHAGQVLAQRPGTCGTRTLGPELRYPVPLRLELAPLLCERVATCLRLLPVADPRRALFLGGRLGLAQRLTRRLQLLLRGAFQFGGSIELRRALSEAGQVLVELGDG